MSDDFYTGPTVLGPVRVARGERVGRWLVGPLALLFLIVLLIFYVFYSAHSIDGDSMEPSLYHGERTLVTRGRYSPRRGDIVIFDAIEENGQPEGYVKRVIAIPGDVITVTGGVATVNGEPEGTPSFLPDPRDPVVIESSTVAAGHVFVLGDNRPISLDSRRIGLVPLSSIEGHVVFVWAPVGHIRAVD